MTRCWKKVAAHFKKVAQKVAAVVFLEKVPSFLPHKSGSFCKKICFKNISIRANTAKTIFAHNWTAVTLWQYFDALFDALIGFPTVNLHDHLLENGQLIFSSIWSCCLYWHYCLIVYFLLVKHVADTKVGSSLHHPLNTRELHGLCVCVYHPSYVVCMVDGIVVVYKWQKVPAEFSCTKREDRRKDCQKMAKVLKLWLTDKKQKQ